MLNQLLPCLAHRLGRGDCSVRPDLDVQSLVVRVLPDASTLNRVVHLAHRGVDGVHGQLADGASVA